MALGQADLLGAVGRERALADRATSGTALPRPRRFMIDASSIHLDLHDAAGRPVASGVKREWTASPLRCDQSAMSSTSSRRNESRRTANRTTGRPSTWPPPERSH